MNLRYLLETAWLWSLSTKKNGEKYKEVKDSQFLPKSHDISPTTATEFWAREKTVVQNALLCCKVRKSIHD